MDPLPPTPFQSGWWSFELGAARPCHFSTYCLFSYESVPPLPEPDPTLSWLHPLPADLDRDMQHHRNSWVDRGRIETIEIDAEQLGLSLPEAFTRLMGSPELQDRIPSCTACTFGLSERILPCPGTDNAYVVPFLRDQQGVFLWCLYLTANGDQCVVTVPSGVDDVLSGETGGDTEQAAFVSATRICAPSFASFIYRFWLENRIWFKLTNNDDTPLTDVERRYLDHYQSENIYGS